MSSEMSVAHPNHPYAKHPDYQMAVTLEDLPSFEHDRGELVFEGTLGQLLDSNLDGDSEAFSLAEIQGIIEALAAHGETRIGMNFRVALAPVAAPKI